MSRFWKGTRRRVANSELAKVVRFLVIALEDYVLPLVYTFYSLYILLFFSRN